MNRRVFLRSLGLATAAMYVRFAPDLAQAVVATKAPPNLANYTQVFRGPWRISAVSYREVVDASSLPEADIIKIDTEGAESSPSTGAS